MAISSSIVGLGISIGIFAILALGMNIKFGFTGLLEIGHVAFYLLGAYTTALLVLPPASQNPGQEYILGLSMPWLPAILIAALFTGLMGALVSLPAIRLREDYLAITLLGISFVILQIFRSPNFRWLANGPRALAGFERPLTDLFPLPGDTLSSVLLFGIVVAFVWAVAIYLLGRLDGVRSPSTAVQRLATVLFALTTLGIGYVFGRLAHREDRRPDERYALLGGLVAGGLVVGALLGARSLAATAAAVIGFEVTGGAAILVFVLGAASLFSWIYGAVAFARYYGTFGAREYLAGLGLALVFLATFLPLVLLGSDQNDVTSAVGMLVTFGLLGGFFYGLYRLRDRWSDLGIDVGLVRVIGVGAIWLFLLRYFVLSMVQPFKNNGLGYVLDQTIQNLLWLVRFDPNAGITFQYTRFLFLLVMGTLIATYVLAEVTAKSPFGRVLKAIREDEDVATALGKNTFAYKVQSMAVGSAIAGVAGSLTAIQTQALTWQLFLIQWTFVVLLMVIIGGTANNKGAILGSIVFWAFTRGTSDIAGFFPAAAGSSIAALRLVIIGALLIVILYYRPEGIWGEETGLAGGSTE